MSSLTHHFDIELPGHGTWLMQAHGPRFGFRYLERSRAPRAVTITLVILMRPTFDAHNTSIAGLTAWSPAPPHQAIAHAGTATKYQRFCAAINTAVGIMLNSSGADTQ